MQMLRSDLKCVKGEIQRQKLSREPASLHTIRIRDPLHKLCYMALYFNLTKQNIESFIGAGARLLKSVLDEVIKLFFLNNIVKMLDRPS